MESNLIYTQDKPRYHSKYSYNPSNHTITNSFNRDCKQEFQVEYHLDSTICSI